MVEGAGGEFQGVDGRGLGAGRLALLCEGAPPGRWDRDAAIASTAPLAGGLGDAERVGPTAGVPRAKPDLGRVEGTRLPSFQQLMLPVLRTLGGRYDEISVSALEDEVAKALRISAEERARRPG